MNHTTTDHKCNRIVGRGRTSSESPSCSRNNNRRQGAMRLLIAMILLAHLRQRVQGFSSASGRIASFRAFSSSGKGLEAAGTSDDLAEYVNKNNREDQVFSALSEDGGIKVTAVTARNLLNDMSLQHTMTKTPTDALGRAVVCGLLMANGIQEEQMVQLSLNCDGPIRSLVAIVGGNGSVKGYVGSPMLGDIPLVDAVGKGSVNIVKNHPDWPRPYNGITAIRHGDIDRDIGIYLAESEQRSCALAAATSINGILCTAAGGYLVEQLPGVEPSTIAQVEKNLAKLVEMDGGDALPASLLQNGVSPLEIAETVLDGLGMTPLQQIKPELVCECTEDRLLRSLRLLPKEDVDDILEKEEKVEARCEFCGKVYSFQVDEMKERLANASGDPSKDSDFNQQ